MNRGIERPIMIELVWQNAQFAWRISMSKSDGSERFQPWPGDWVRPVFDTAGLAMYRRRAICYPAGVDLLAVRARLPEAVTRWRETRKGARSYERAAAATKRAAAALPKAKPWDVCAVVGCSNATSGAGQRYCWEHGTRERLF